MQMICLWFPQKSQKFNTVAKMSSTFSEFLDGQFNVVYIVMCRPSYHVCRAPKEVSPTTLPNDPIDLQSSPAPCDKNEKVTYVVVGRSIFCKTIFIYRLAQSTHMIN